MFGRDQGWGTIYESVAHRNQRGKLFKGERCRFWCHAASMDCFGNPAWSILLTTGKFGKVIAVRWRLALWLV
jgi:hypothetical protein